MVANTALSQLSVINSSPALFYVHTFSKLEMSFLNDSQVCGLEHSWLRSLQLTSSFFPRDEDGQTARGHECISAFLG